MKQNSKNSTSFKTILLRMNADDKIDWANLAEKPKKVLQANMMCHTEDCGLSWSTCTECGHMTLHYGSCNTAGCLECGMVRREKWLDKQRAKVINAPAYHIVFTVPAELNRLFLACPVEFGNLHFQAQAEALKAISRDPRYFGAQTVGFFSVQHTWGANLSLHPHVHTVFYGAGLDENGHLVYPKYHRLPQKGSGKNRKKKRPYLFPAKKLAKLFKDSFLEKAQHLFGYPGSPWLEDLSRAQAKDWQVQICDALNSPETVIQYLGRYVNRSAISNSRIQSYDGKNVAFTFKDYKDQAKVKTMTLSDKEFLRRFLMHVPPAGFTRIRYYGFLGNNSKNKLEKMKQLTQTGPEPALRTTEEILASIFGEDYNRCEKCKGETVPEYESKKPQWTRAFLIQRVMELRSAYQNRYPKFASRNGLNQLIKD